MVSRHPLRAVRVMHCPRSVMMSHVRGLRAGVVVMSVLPLVLLKSHQPVPGVQIPAVSKIVGVFVDVRVGIPVEVPVNAAFRRRRLVMVLIRV